QQYIRKFMDRIYYVDNSIYYKFIKYAETNEFIYKASNKNYENKFIIDGKVKSLQMSIYLKYDVERYNSVPYVDTLKYAYHTKLSNNSLHEGYILNNTD